jgi:carboxyl-terminal processing protease
MYFRFAILIALVLSTNIYALESSSSSSGIALKTKSSSANNGVLPLEELRTFTHVYDQVRNGYVDEIDDATLLEYAIKGMISELDPHSTFLDKELLEDLQANTSGEFGGVGLEVSIDDGFVKVVTPIDGSPSAKAGITSGDIIIRIDDKPIKGMQLTKAINMMRGPKDSKVKLTIVREGADAPMEFELARDIIKVQSVRARFLENDYLYLRIAQFQVDTDKEMNETITLQLKKNPNTKGIILDLRNNPGGVLQASVNVADSFLNGGQVVYTQGRMENTNVSYDATVGDVANSLPLIVLINDGSASASEIVAGALQDHKRAVIMGTRSFGKGSVQSIIPISKDRAIKLTTALYYTPSGRSIQAQGIEPDVRVERVQITSVEQQLMQTTEADLSGHLNNTQGGKESSSTERAKDTDTNSVSLKEDNQLHEALNLLKGLHIFIQKSPLVEPEKPLEETMLIDPKASLEKIP